MNPWKHSLQRIVLLNLLQSQIIVQNRLLLFLRFIPIPLIDLLPQLVLHSQTLLTGERVYLRLIKLSFFDVMALHLCLYRCLSVYKLLIL